MATFCAASAALDLLMPRHLLAVAMLLLLAHRCLGKEAFPARHGRLAWLIHYHCDSAEDLGLDAKR